MNLLRSQAGFATQSLGAAISGLCSLSPDGFGDSSAHALLALKKPLLEFKSLIISPLGGIKGQNMI